MGGTSWRSRRKARLDGYYVEHLSFGMDVKCFFGTITALLKHDGVVEGGTGTLHEETGKEPLRIAANEYFQRKKTGPGRILDFQISHFC